MCLLFLLIYIYIHQFSFVILKIVWLIFIIIQSLDLIIIVITLLLKIIQYLYLLIPTFNNQFKMILPVIIFQNKEIQIFLKNYLFCA